MSDSIFPSLPVPLSGEIRLHGDAAALHINGEPVLPFMYCLTDVPGGRWPWEEIPHHNLRQFARAGVELFQITEYFDFLWQEDGSFSVENTRRQIRGILEVCPKAAIMLRLFVHPPKWWYALNPDECVAYADIAAKPDYKGGLLRIIEEDPGHPLRHSLASQKWLRDMDAALGRFCRDLAGTPEGNAVMSILLLSGVYGEWHYWGFMNHEPDVSPAMTKHFRRWLQQRYGSDAALQEAWGETSVTCASALVPGTEVCSVFPAVPGIPDRRTAKAGAFRDPQQERRVIDYFTCQHELVADDILLFGKTVKDNWPRPIVTGAFYGYMFSLFERETYGGHLAMTKVLQSPNIDCLVGPQCYYPDSRDPGNLPRPRGLTASYRLHGKLWMDEYDIEPCVPHFSEPTYLAGMHTAIQEMRKHVLCSYAEGMGFWFFDFGVAGLHQHPREGDTKNYGWWDYPEMLAEIARLRDVLAERFTAPFRRDADVLMVYDTDVYYHLSVDPAFTPLASVQNYWGQAAVGKCGIQADYAHIDDLAKLDLASYTTVVFNNTFLITEERAAVIRDRVLRDGRDVIWCYAPGYTDGQSFSVDRMSALTGMTLRPIDLSETPEVAVEGLFETPMTYKMSDGPITPLFAVSDPQAERLASYQGTEAVAIAYKATPHFNCWYLGLPSYDYRVLQAIFRRTRAHQFNDRGDIFLSGGGVLMVHGTQPGPCPVTLRNGTTVTLTIPVGGLTALLDNESGQVLLG